MRFKLRILFCRIKRTIKDYRTMWYPEGRSKRGRLISCWNASRILISVDYEKQKIYEIGK